MKFFKHDKKNDYEYYSFESKDVSGTDPKDFDDDTFTMPLDIFDSGISAWGKRSDKGRAPHALTANELMGTNNGHTTPEKIQMVPPSMKTNSNNMSPAAQSLFEKMLKAQEEKFDKEILEPGSSASENEHPKTDLKDSKAPAVAKPILEKIAINNSSVAPTSIPMEQTSAKPAIPVNPGASSFAAKQVVGEPIESLLKKCQNFINADDGMPTYKPTIKPAYTLDSVNDIISSAEKKAQDRISRLYGDKKATVGNPNALTSNDLASIKTKSAVPEASLSDISKIPMTPLVNVRKTRFFETPINTGSAEVSDSVAKEVPIKIKVIDNNTTNGVLTQNTDSTAPKSKTSNVVLNTENTDAPINVATDEVENPIQNSDNGIQFSLADDSVVNPPTSASGNTCEINIKNHVVPTHALFVNKKSIKPQLLDELNSDLGETINFAPVKKAVEPQEKINFFGDSEEDSTEGDVIHSKFDDESEDSIDDYTCLDDAPEIHLDLLSRRQKLIARMVPTALITVALLVMNSSFCSSFASELGNVWGTVQLGLLLIAAVININTMKGLGGLFTLNPDMDSPTALAVLAVVLQSVLSLLLFGGANNQLCAVASLGLVFNGFGKFLIINRVIKGFGNIANSNIKRALQFVHNDISASAMSRGAIDGDALICVGRRTVNITGFLNNSYREDPYERVLSKIILASLVLSLVSALLGFLFIGTMPAVLMTFALVLCLCCPPSSLMLCNLPLKVAANTLDNYDATLAGFTSAESIAESNAVAVNVLDIFPAGSVKLFKMHLLSKNAVDHSLMEAAAVVIGAKSPLGDIFKQILADDINNLPAVDAITYEDKMGLSGWIGERRILVGNRALMEGHAIKLPSIGVDNKILRSSFFPVYIAVDGKPCVLLVVGYEADEDITHELRRLCSTGVTLLVNSCDSNVTEQMICDYFGLFDDSVKLISTSAVQLYKQETNYMESTKAPACFGNSICGFFAAVTASIRIKTISAIMAAIHIIGIFCGIALTIYMLSSGQIQLLTSIAIVAVQLIFTCITAIVPYLKRP